MDRDLHLVDLDFPATRLERNDEAFGYRIYRLDTPMQPGEGRSLAFRTYREQVGFRACGTEMGVAPNGTGRHLRSDAANRHERCRPDRGAGRAPPAVAFRNNGRFRGWAMWAPRALIPNGDVGWTAADITISTTADQIAIARASECPSVSRTTPDGEVCLRGAH